MVALRSRRLETLLGSSLDDIDDGVIHRLIEISAQEDFDLDFKKTCYGRSDADQRSLATDVAAFANAAGGLLILGIEENEQGQAVGAPGVALSDAEIGRMRQIIASQVAPLPLVDIFMVIDEPAGIDPANGEGAVAHGFFILAVPRSTLAPHAVRVNESLRFPMRHGQTTRYLAEYEVAAAYRSRTRSEGERHNRIARAESEAISRLGREEDAWLVVTLSPSIPGMNQITIGNFQPLIDRYANSQFGPIHMMRSFSRAQVGFRRLLVSDSYEPSAMAYGLSLELHNDGLGTSAVRFNSIKRRDPFGKDEKADAPYVLSEELLAASAINSLFTLALHARDNASAAGECLLQARLVTATKGQEIVLGHTRSGSYRPGRPLSVMGHDLPFATTGASLDDLCETSAPLVSSAARLLAELFQMFGLPESPQVSLDGRLRKNYWNYDWQQIVAPWAESNGIEIIEDTPW